MQAKGTGVRSRMGGISFARVVCAVIIICFHYSSHSSNPFRLLYKTANSSWGGLAVTTFFVISGACLYINYPDLRTGTKLKAYFFKRWKSIFPMFYLCFLIFFALNVRHTGKLFYLKDAHPLSLLLTVLGMDGYLLYRIPNYYIIGEWFLGAIILLYCLYPLMLLASNRSPFIIPAILAAGYVLVFGTDVFMIQPFQNLIVCGASFYAGMVLAKHRERVLGHFLIPCICAALFLLLAIVPLPSSLKRFSVIIMQLHGFLFCIPLIYAGRMLEKTRLQKVLDWTGGLSYPIFLLHHQIVVRILRISDPQGIWGVIGLSLGCVALSIVCAYLISWINRLLTRTPVFTRFESRFVSPVPKR